MQRMIVVPPSFFEKWRKIFEQDKHLSDLDLEMKRVLYSKNLNNTDKWHLYRQNLMRYLLTIRKKREMYDNVIKRSTKPTKHIMYDKESQYDEKMKDEKMKDEKKFLGNTIEDNMEDNYDERDNIKLPLLKNQKKIEKHVFSPAQNFYETASEGEDDEDSLVNDENFDSRNDYNLDDTIKLPSVNEQLTNMRVTRARTRNPNSQSSLKIQNPKAMAKQLRWTTYK